MYLKKKFKLSIFILVMLFSIVSTLALSDDRTPKNFHDMDNSSGSSSMQFSLRNKMQQIRQQQINQPQDIKNQQYIVEIKQRLVRIEILLNTLINQDDE